MGLTSLLPLSPLLISILSTVPKVAVRNRDYVLVILSPSLVAELISVILSVDPRMNQSWPELPVS